MLAKLQDRQVGKMIHGSGYGVECNDCGRSTTFAFATDKQSVADALNDRGWRHNHRNHYTLCPQCAPHWER